MNMQPQFNTGSIQSSSAYYNAQQCKPFNISVHGYVSGMITIPQIEFSATSTTPADHLVGVSAPSIEATSTVQSHYSLYRQVLSHRRKVRAVTVVPSVDICVDVLIIVIPILGQADCATSIRLRSSQDITARLTALAMTLTNPFAQAQSILNPTAEASTSLWSRPNLYAGFH